MRGAIREDAALVIERLDFEKWAGAVAEVDLGLEARPLDGGPDLHVGAVLARGAEHPPVPDSGRAIPARVHKDTPGCRRVSDRDRRRPERVPHPVTEAV